MKQNKYPSAQPILRKESILKIFFTVQNDSIFPPGYISWVAA
jgi:hypothetical protein